MEIIEALCVCDSPYCHHTKSTGEILPCPNLASGKFYVLGYGSFCRECANNYAILYGNDQVVKLRKPESLIQALDMPGMMLPGELEQSYLDALAMSEPDMEDESA